MKILSISNSHLAEDLTFYRCYQFLKRDSLNNNFIITITLTEINDNLKRYLKYLKRIFRTIEFVKLNFNNNVVTFEIDYSASEDKKKRLIYYTCFVLFRFAFRKTSNIDFEFINEWNYLYKKYLKKNKFKLILWMNNKYPYTLEYKTLNSNEYFKMNTYSFYSSEPTKFYEIISFKEVIERIKFNDFDNLNDIFESKELSTVTERDNYVNNILKQL